jgi:hypothetical protein
VRRLCVSCVRCFTGSFAFVSLSVWFVLRESRVVLLLFIIARVCEVLYASLLVT